MRFTPVIGLLIVAVMNMAAINPPAPTSEQMEADPNYTRVDSQVVEGTCVAIDPLADIIRQKDNVQTVRVVQCKQLLFTKPNLQQNEKRTSGEADLFAFIDAQDKSGTYFRGIWNDGDFEFTAISFDQLEWHDVSKGRARFFQNEEDGSLIIVVFAVFENGETQGVAFALESA